MKIYFKFSTAAVAALFILFAFNSCDESDTVDPHEEHFHAEGLILKSGDEIAFKTFENQIVSEITQISTQTDGELDFDVFFVDHDGEEKDPPEEDHFSLTVEVADATIARALADATGEWKFKLQGLATGETTMIVYVMHEDHYGFKSLDIPVVVD